MAVKDHSLDAKIIKSARQEFLKHGYRNASLHTIANKADITTGALYTRYKGKDDLFLSLVKNVLENIELDSSSIKEQYLKVQDLHDPKQIIAVINNETKIYDDLFKNNYEECFLFYCRSEGSSVEKILEEMMQKKIDMTIAYFKQMARKDADLSSIAVLMRSQFILFKQMMEDNYAHRLNTSSLELINKFQEAGWKAVLEAIL